MPFNFCEILIVGSLHFSTQVIDIGQFSLLRRLAKVSFFVATKLIPGNDAEKNQDGDDEN